MADPAGGTPNFEQNDIELVKLFLAHYKDSKVHSYKLTSRPDTVIRNRKAIEALAKDERGHILAVEHTLLQAFEGQKADDFRFLKVFEPLQNDKSLQISDRFIEVFPPAFAIPTGVNWETVRDRVYEWFKATRDQFPKEGDSWHDIPNLGFDLKVLVQSMEVPGSEGFVRVGRIRPIEKPFIDVLQRALNDKVPKLVATTADKHILLLEHEGTSVGFTEITIGIDSTVEKLSELKQVDEVWVVHSMEWKTSGFLIFVYVWPGGVKDRYSVLDERFKKPAPAMEAR